MRRSLHDRRGERGVSMVFTLLSLGMVTMVGLTLASVGMSTLSMATAETETAETLAIADAGIEHAKQLVLFQEWNSLNVFLGRGDALGCSFDELSGPPTGALPLNYPASATQADIDANFIRATGRPFGQGRYYVQLCDNHATELTMAGSPVGFDNRHVDADKKIRVRSIAIGPNGTRAAVEALFGAAAMPAVVVNGNLEVKGNPEIAGPAGSVHSNGTLLLSGNPCTHVYYASTQGTTTTGNVQGGANCTAADVDSRPFSPKMNIPELTPYHLALQASEETLKPPFSAVAMPVYTMMSDGKVYRGLPAGTRPNGTQVESSLVGPLSGAQLPSGWTFQANKWKVAHGTTDGTYYVQDNVEIGANTKGIARSAGAPFYIDPSKFGTLPSTLTLTDTDGNPNNGPYVFMTVIAEGSISANGNPDVSAAADLFLRGRIMMVAGHDLDLGATFDSAYEGLFYARHQVNISGNPTLNGQVIALNKADAVYQSENPVTLTSGVMKITGSPKIYYSGNGLQSVRALTWRECRGTWQETVIVAGVMTRPGSPCGDP